MGHIFVEMSSIEFHRITNTQLVLLLMIKTSDSSALETQVLQHGNKFIRQDIIEDCQKMIDVFLFVTENYLLYFLLKVLYSYMISYKSKRFKNLFIKIKAILKSFQSCKSLVKIMKFKMMQLTSDMAQLILAKIEYVNIFFFQLYKFYFLSLLAS